MKIIFFGSDDFAAAHLKNLIDSGHNIVACVTQPDRPKGRGMKIVLSKIKEYAQEFGIPVFQPSAITDGGTLNDLSALNADLSVVIAYGQFIPRDMRELPKYGSINVHPSLLPKYRGAAPINWALIKGETETGISIIRIVKEMDAGDILASARMEIYHDDNAITLKERMMEFSPPFLLDTINAIENNKTQPVPQNSRDVTYAPKLNKELGAIDWAKKSDEIYNLVRGTLPWPTAYTGYKGKTLKILEAQVFKQASGNEPGKVLEVNKEGIVVATGNGSLLIRKVHLQDAKPMDADAFVRGHKVEVGFNFE